MKTHSKSTAFADAVIAIIADQTPADRIAILNECAAVILKMAAKELATINATGGSNVVQFPRIARPIPEARQ